MIIIKFNNFYLIKLNKYKMKRFTQYQDTLIGLKQNSNEELFIATPILGRFYTILSVIITIALFFVKDANKYGVKVQKKKKKKKKKKNK